MRLLSEKFPGTIGKKTTFIVPQLSFMIFRSAIVIEKEFHFQHLQAGLSKSGKRYSSWKDTKMLT